MEIIVCPKCQIRVAVGDDRTCPGCRMYLNDFTSRVTPADGDNGSADVNAKQNAVRDRGDQQKTKAEPAKTHFDLFSVCFGFKGRIPRSVYWIAVIGSGIVFYFILIAALSVLRKESSTTPFVLLFLLFLFLWSQFAIAGKRFHDIGMSGLWFPLLLLPGIGILVQFLLLGLRRGEQGENKYGRDPLELFE